MRRFATMTLGLIASVALLSTGIAAAGGSVPTKVTIKGPNGDFHGKILSKSQDCLGDRRVAVFEQLGDQQDPPNDDRNASTTSERDGDHGEWSVGNTGERDGFFYARAARSPGCRATGAGRSSSSTGCAVAIGCPGWDSNPHGPEGPTGPKPVAYRQFRHPGDRSVSR